MAQDSLELGRDIPHWEDAPDHWVALRDSHMVYRGLGGADSLVPAIEISEGINYQMFDSACIVEYTFCELRRNNHRISLLTWIDGRISNASAATLSAASASDTFTVHEGDSISFYRQVTWQDTLRNRDTDNYKAVDTLGWAVELVRDGDSVRAATLHSLTVLPTTAPARPTIFSSRPLYATVMYVVPSYLDGQSVFVRHRVYHRGTGLRHFTRSDIITVGASRAAADTNFDVWFSLTGHSMPK